MAGEPLYHSFVDDIEKDISCIYEWLSKGRGLFMHIYIIRQRLHDHAFFTGSMCEGVQRMLSSGALGFEEEA